MKLLFDLETNGLYDDVSTVHCIVAKDLNNGKIYKFTSEGKDEHGSIDNGIELLEKAEGLVGHNIINYDIPVIYKLYGLDLFSPTVEDTLVLSRLIHTELKRFDFSKRTDIGFPKKLAGSHALEAWGHRLGSYKEQKPDSWEKYTPEMLEYCCKDIEVNEVLYEKLKDKPWSEESIRLEHDVAFIISLQEKAGVAFDTKKAGRLYADWLEERTGFEKKLIEKFTGWYKDEGEFTPKVNNKSRGYVKGCTFNKIKWIPFNPQSRQHCVKVLKDNYGWKPKKFTDAGNAIFNESVLLELQSIPSAKVMHDYLTIQKRISQLAEGKQAWLKLVGSDGLLHGRVNSNGAITGRMTHYKPNISQVPAGYSPYGKECRELFTVRKPSNYLVGADADGLELRCLAHYLYPYDGGRYANAVLHGNKEDGTDAHSLTLKALGNLCKDRDMAKTFFYALIYGASDYKLGLILGRTKAGDCKNVGKEARRRVEVGIKGLGKLREKIDKILSKRQRLYKRKWLTGLDGRKIYIRSEHAALNSLLQSAGGLIMKKALVILHHALSSLNYKHGEDYLFVINSHDEWQIETLGCTPEIIGAEMVNAMTKAGEYFDFKVPITGEYKIGQNWKDTH